MVNETYEIRRIGEILEATRPRSIAYLNGNPRVLSRATSEADRLGIPMSVYDSSEDVISTIDSIAQSDHDSVILGQDCMCCPNPFSQALYNPNEDSDKQRDALTQMSNPIGIVRLMNRMHRTGRNFQVLVSESPTTMNDPLYLVDHMVREGMNYGVDPNSLVVH